MTTPIRFYTDVHVNRKAVSQLRKKGVDIVHCGEAGMLDAPDSEHLMYTTHNKMVMVSCDEDFIILHHQYQERNEAHGGIVYFRMPDQCSSIGLIVREILFLHQAANYENDLANQVWRVKS
jgi:predicted nuclease of predicted toxin-antitoxin system